MGQANNRGTREERILIAIERKQVEAQRSATEKALVRLALLKKEEEAHLANEALNAERIARGEKPLPMLRLGRRTNTTRLGLLAAIAMLSA